MNVPSQTHTVQAADLVPERTATGALVRLLLDSRPASGLRRQLVELAAGSWLDGDSGPGGELWFVVCGRGRADVAGQPGVLLEPDVGVLVPAGLAYQVRVEPEDGDGLRLDIVALPGAGRSDPGPALLLARDLAGCAVEVTGDRQFRVLFGPGLDCATATQFVGEIPPGRAPDHSHPYDETVLVLAGHGILHVNGVTHALAPGTCTRLPPGLPHCLENTGTSVLRVLGVFHPADSPAAKLTS